MPKSYFLSELWLLGECKKLNPYFGLFLSSPEMRRPSRAKAPLLVLSGVSTAVTKVVVREPLINGPKMAHWRH